MNLDEPYETGSTPLRHLPRLDSWHDHFVLDEVVIVGLTPIGRATVRLLRMNADDRRKVRAALRARGEWDS
jgi:hypothetical protein